MSETPKIAYVTKYALTSGLKAFPLEDIVDGKMAVVLIPGPAKRREYYHGLDWHLNRDDAIARAEEMRIAKIASLRKQIAKLEALSFDVMDEGGNDGREAHTDAVGARAKARRHILHLCRLLPDRRGVEF